LLLLLFGLHGTRVEAALEPFEITDCLGLVDGGVQPGDRRPGLARGEIGSGDPAFEQTDLGRERIVPAGEEGERLIRAASLPDPDYALALSGAHVDSPVVSYPAPRMAFGAHRLPPARYLIRTCPAWHA